MIEGIFENAKFRAEIERRARLRELHAKSFDRLRADGELDEYASLLADERREEVARMREALGMEDVRARVEMLLRVGR